MLIYRMLLLAQIVIFSLAFVASEDYTSNAEVSPQGLLPDCPGSWKPAIIKPASLKKLFISVVGANGDLAGAYNYYRMHDLAKNPEMDFRKKTVMYIGGYLDSTSWHTGHFLGLVYKREGYNALILDTLEFTATIYPLAVRLMHPIGKHVAEMLVILKEYGLDPKKLELVGISLGGHTMGFVAKNYRLLTGQNISSLTALDPAGPCFRNAPPDQRLDKTDADFVLGVITNTDGSGISVPVGHVLFYVNGGEFQNGHYWWLPCDVACSHIRSYYLWWSALLYPGSFIGIRCDSQEKAKQGDCFDGTAMVTNTMDLFTDRSKPGIYYLATSNRWPFVLGNKGLRKHRTDTYAPRITSSQQIDVPDLVKNLYSFFFNTYARY